MATNIYVAASWRNPYHARVLEAIREYGQLKGIEFDIYDFKNPTNQQGVGGFSWGEIDPEWRTWTVKDFEEGLRHPRAQQGFEFDRDALEKCDVCILVLPSGMSAHLEAGWAGGRGASVLIYAPELREPELMYKLFDFDGYTPIYDDLDTLLEVLGNHSE